MQNKHEGRWIEALGQAHDSREPAWAGVSGGIQLKIQSHKGRKQVVSLGPRISTYSVPESLNDTHVIAFVTGSD